MQQRWANPHPPQPDPQVAAAAAAATAGARSAPATLNERQGFLLVFSITSLNSLSELAELRDQIIRIKDDTKVPLVIVGNKSDLEDDRAVSKARAFATSQGWGGAPYYETSARRRDNVDEVFVDLCRQIIGQDPSIPQTREYDHRERRRHRPNRHSRRGRRKEKPPCSIL
ncbi:MAG: hypothetical protein M1825_001281 [Sarcosagium campestre]|nr:MAG: hypothetical protein M1825_001281 [Sarcosagium campestre]